MNVCKLPRARPRARRVRQVACLLVTLGALLRPREAQAESPVIVLVAVEGHAHKLEEQLQAELRAAALTPQTIAWRDVRIGPDGLSTPTDARAASALLRVTSRPSAIEVWIASRAGDPLTRRESVPRAPDDADARLVAMRTSELVRAALLPVRELQPETPPAPPPDASTAVSPAPTNEPASPASTTPTAAENPPQVQSNHLSAGHSERSARFGGSLGTTLSGDRDGFGRGVRVNLDATFRVGERWTLASVTMLPTVAQVVRESSGRVALRAGLLELELRRELAAPHQRLRPRIGLGAGLGWAHLRTRHDAPLTVHRTTQVESCLLALVGGSLRVWSRLSIALDFRAGAALPRAVARLDGHRVGSAGIPLLLGSLSLELPFG